MCGIFGIIVRSNAAVTYTKFKLLLEQLYCLSESRGKESAGLYAYAPTEGKAWVLKESRRASQLLRSVQYRTFINEHLKTIFATPEEYPSSSLAVFAHSRLVTNGTAELSQNNQPVCSGPVNIIHNGIVVNVDSLWNEQSHLVRQADVDSEVMAAMIAYAVSKGKNPQEATIEVFFKIQGAASIAWLHEQANWGVLATNTGDLYYANIDNDCFVFASERYIIEQALLSSKMFRNVSVYKLEPGNGIVIELTNLSQHHFSFDGADKNVYGSYSSLIPRPLIKHDLTINNSSAIKPLNIMKADKKLLRYNESNIQAMHRCTRCVLPETFPFIRFDKQGVCNYCHNYRTHYKDIEPTRAKENFIKSLEKYRSKNKTTDVLIPFSGGRDSSYGLHLIKKEFGLTPITFTYDWGMVTDLARRNIARMCGCLGVENILVSADIRKKRDNIRKNVAAWLHKPDLGMVPLFMAGDKQFFRIINQLKRQTGISLNLWCANPLENTDFKSGFCNIEPDFEKKRLDYLSFGSKVRLASYYGVNFMSNYRYLNTSLLDTFSAFLAYYLEARNDFYFVFNHMLWNEEDVNQVLLTQYDWELAPDTNSTWRIGDGTAPFYNYIYVTAKGFSEFDTFRSNQIREGMITREAALAAVIQENKPRVESLQWYLNTLGLDFDSTIKRINELDVFALHR